MLLPAWRVPGRRFSVSRTTCGRRTNGHSRWRTSKNYLASETIAANLISDSSAGAQWRRGHENDPAQGRTTHGKTSLVDPTSVDLHIYDSIRHCIYSVRRRICVGTHPSRMLTATYHWRVRTLESEDVRQLHEAVEGLETAYRQVEEADSHVGSGFYRKMATKAEWMKSVDNALSTQVLAGDQAVKEEFYSAYNAYFDVLSEIYQRNEFRYDDANEHREAVRLVRFHTLSVFKCSGCVASDRLGQTWLLESRG